MDILSYFSLRNDNRILLAQDTAMINALVRQYHVETGGVKIMSLTSAVREIVSYHDAKNNQHHHFLSHDYAFALFDQTIRRNIQMFPYYASHEHLLDQETMKEVFRIVNLVRSGNVQKDTIDVFTENEEDRNRIRDCFAIADVYASALQEKKMIDQTGLLLCALEEVSCWQENEMALPEVTILQEDGEEYSYVQKLLTEKIQNITNTVVKEVCLPASFYEFLNNQKRDRVSFFKGFGSVNEIKYVIYNILKQGYPFGSVGIQYVNPADVTTLQSELERNQIPYCFTDPIPAFSNPVVEWIQNVLVWAQNDFEEKYLENVLLNRLFAQRNEDAVFLPSRLLEQMTSGSYKIDDNGTIRRVEYYTGWSLHRYSRLIELLDGCSNNPNFSSEKQAEYEFLANYMRQLTEIFQTDLSLISVFQKIVLFLDTFYTGDGVSYLKIKPSLDEMLNMYRFINDDRLAFSEVIGRMKDDLQNIRLSDEEKADAVQLQSFSRFHVLERQHTYVIGMSAVNMKNTASQSPILSDAELKYFIHDSFLPISENLGPLTQKKNKMTLASNPEVSLHLGYNFFDTQEKAECNPAVILQELFALYGVDHKQIPTFEYGLPSQAVSPLDLPIAVVEKNEDPDLFGSVSQFSATSLEALSECPKKFYYRYIRKLEPLEFFERHPSRWLDARNKGNLVHSILEQYARQVFRYTSDISYDPEVYREILTRAAAQYETIIPPVEPWIMNLQIREIAKQIESYLIELHEEYTHSNWEFLLAECSFNDVVLHDEIDMNLVGKIDRIDYRIDENTKTIYLRTIDYKTGKKSNVEKKVTAGEAQQRRVYTTALFQENLLMQMKQRISKLNRNVRFPEYKFCEDGFYYVFIGDQETNEDSLVSITAKKPVLTDEDDTASSYRLSNMIHHCISTGEFLDRFTIGQMMEKEYEYDEFSLKEGVIANLCGPMGKRGNKRNKPATKCTYCPFGEICNAYRN